MADELQRVVEQALAQGWQVDPRPNGRLRWRAPDGVGQAFTPQRVGSGRSLENITARLHRAGLRLPERETLAHATDKEEELVAATRNGAKPATTGASGGGKSEATLSDILLDAAGKVDALVRRNAELERENNELRHELASARTRAEDVRREAMAAVERVLTQRGVS